MGAVLSLYFYSKFVNVGRRKLDKNFNAFMGRVKETPVNEYGMDESKIWFKEVKEENAVPEDYLFAVIERDETHKATCSMCIKEAYSRYIAGEDFGELLEAIASAIREVENYHYLQKANELFDYKEAKENLFIRLVNKDKNAEELKNAVYRTMGDIAFVLYFRVGNYKGDTLCMKVRRDYVNKWGIEACKVLDAALLNTYRMTPPRIYWWEKLMFMEEYEGEEFMNPDSKFQIRKGVIGNCLSTTEKTGGAVAVFMPGVAERLGKLLEDDF